MTYSTYLNEQSFSLTYLDRFKIENEAEGLSDVYDHRSPPDG